MNRPPRDATITVSLYLGTLMSFDGGTVPVPKSRKRPVDRNSRRARTGRPRTKSSLTEVDVLDLHFAIVSGKWEATGGLSATRPVVYGTAFPILPGVLATALHVISSAEANGELAVCRVEGTIGARELRTYRLRSVERYRDVDFALLECPDFQHLAPMPVSFDPLAIFDEAKAIGYPFALDPERLTLVHRGFSVHVVTRRELYHVPGQPPGYELSFPTPKGLSGAPLVARCDDGLCCYGYVVQQQSVTVEGQETRLGIAIASEVMLSMRSKMVGGVALANLFGREFVPKRRPTPIRNPMQTGTVSTNDLDGWPDDPPAPEDRR